MLDLSHDPIYKDELLNDVVFIIDTREQTPWDFTILDSDKIKIVQEKATLTSGDYSLYGYESAVSLERKNLDDLVGCAGNGRERFEAELRRLRGYSAAAVVVEAPWESIEGGNWRSKIRPSSVVGSCIGWQQWKIPFHFAKDPHSATIWAAKFLIMFHKRFLEQQKKIGKSALDRRKKILGDLNEGPRRI